jgi:superkiller protein 3
MPTFAQPWNGLGDVYADMGRTDEAMKAYHKSIELNRQYITPWIRLGVLYTKQERYREAVKAYQRALLLDARNSAIWNELGSIYIKTTALEQAAEAFSKAIELDRGCGWAYSNLAYTYTLQGNYKQTISLLLRSIDLLQSDKDKAVSWNRLANVYRLLDDYDNAIAAYQMADRLDLGNRPSMSINLPILEQTTIPTTETEPVPAPESREQVEAKTAPQNAACAQTTDVVATDEQVTKPLRPLINPKLQDAPAWIFNSQGEGASVSKQEVAQAYSISQRIPFIEEVSATHSASSDMQSVHTEAVTMGSAATASPAENEVPSMDALKWIEQGNTCFNRGAFEDAIKAYNKAIQLDPLFGVPYSNLALTYLTQGHFAEAVLLFRKSIDLLHSDADKAISWNGLGNAYRCMNDYSNAVPAYQKAAELDPQTAGIRERAEDFQVAQPPRDAQGWNDLGELFAKTGSADEAINAFQQAIELEPGAGQSYSNLAHTLASQNKYEQAIPFYQKSIDLLPDNKEKATAWNRLGNVYRKLNDYDNAIKAYQKAVVLADEGVDLLTRTRFSLLSNCYVNP